MSLNFTFRRLGIKVGETAPPFTVHVALARTKVQFPAFTLESSQMPGNSGSRGFDALL